MRRAWVLAAAVVVGLSCRVGDADAGAWTQPHGRFWVKTAAIYQFTHDIYAAEAAVLPGGERVGAGDRRPFDDDGASRQRLLWSEAEFGLTDRITLGVQIPYYDLRFEDAGQIIESWGVGDVRFLSRIAILAGSQRLSLRGAWKLPSGRAATSPDAVPVGEGQTDLDLGLQWGMGLGSRSLSWLGLEGGHRWRLEDTDEKRDPGDEWFWRAELGYGLRPDLGFKLGLQGQRAGETFQAGFRLPGERSVDGFDLSLLLRRGSWLLEPSFGRTLAGEAYPAASTWTLGLSRQFRL